MRRLPLTFDPDAYEQPFALARREERDPVQQASLRGCVTPTDARLMGRVGGLTTISRYGGEKIASRARAGLWRKFEREADPEGVLSEQARYRRAKLVERRYYASLALLSVKARRARKAGSAS